MSADQDKLDADVAALNDARVRIEAEIAELKAVNTTPPLDFTGLDAAVASIQADVPPDAPAGQ